MPDLDPLPTLRATFPDLSDEELGTIAAVTRSRRYPAGHMLCHEGVCEETFYILAEGECAITQRIDDQGGERELRRVGKGSFVGEVALIQNGPRSASACTTRATRVLEIDKGDFVQLLSRSPHMALSIMRVTLERMRQNDQAAVDDLRRTNQTLQLLDRNKLDFIQVAAHELRTPITVMKGSLSVLRADNAVSGNPALLRILDSLAKGTERLHEIVNTMLDVTRIDSDKLRIAPVPVPVRSLLNDIVNRVKRDLSERDLTLTTEYAADLPLIHADQTLIQKAVYQVLLNAVKYTPDGGVITVRTHGVMLDTGEPGIEIIVADTGIGLAPEHQRLIFEKFYQVGSVALHSSGKTTFKGGGPGLGLAIARGVVRAHGGRIWVESPGCDEQALPGSTFYLQLPLHPPAPNGIRS